MATQQDKAALLAQINSAASGVKLTNKDSVISRAKQQLQTDAGKLGLNQRNAADLVSNTPSRAAQGNYNNMRDFDNSYDHSKSLLSAHKMNQMPGNQHEVGDDDLRSLRSEYDYKNKKTFTEVLSSPNKAAQMGRMRQEHAIAGGKQMVDGSFKSIQSRMTGKNSLRSQAARLQHKEMMEKIAEEPAEVPRLVEELVSTLQVCVSCNNSLTKDEKVVNARFIQTAVQNDQDISIFPMCVKCNFDNILNKSGNVQHPSQGLADKPYMPTARKVYDEIKNDNSVEFKQLGTMAPENRITEYYPPDAMGVSFNAENALQDAGFKSLSLMVSPRIMGKPRNSQTIELTGGAQRNYQHPIGDSLKDQNKRLANENQSAAFERNMVTRKAAEATKTQANNNSQMSTQKVDKVQIEHFDPTDFPPTTNQDFINVDVHSRARAPDKTHFRRKNSFQAYVNSMFNQGVFVQPWQDMC